jgi:outer membrane receptor for ferrienterochelin and colicins
MNNSGLTGGIISLLFLLLIIPVFAQQADTTAWSVDLEDVVVTAQYAPTDSKSALHKVKTIKMASIRNRGISDLEKLLEHELNIRISQDMILGSSINLQGMSGQNVKVMIDGVPVIGRVGDNIDISQISLHNVARIEIIEGPLSVHYGTNALGGVINIITRKSQVEKFDLNLASSYESTSEKEVNLGMGFRLLPRLLFRAEGNYFLFDGFNSTPIDDEAYERTHQWNPKQKSNVSGLLRYNFGNDGMLAFRSNLFDEKISNYGVKKRLVFKPYAFDEFYLTRRFDQHLMLESTLWKDYYFKANLAHNHFKREKQVFRLDFEEDMMTELPAEQDTSVFISWVFRPVIASKYKTSNLNFQLGADVNFEEGMGSKISDETLDTSGYSSIGDYALFSSLKYRAFNALDIQLGMRVAYNTRFPSPVVPSLNLKYTLWNHTVIRASYARGFRAPTLKELFLYFVDSNHYIVGNPNLQPEISDNYQLDFDWTPFAEPFQLNFSLGAFYNDIRSKIDLYDFVEVDGEFVPAAELGKTTTDFTYFNQDRFKSLGLNLGLTFKTESLKASLGFAPIGRYNLLPEEVVDVDPFSYVLESNADISYTIQRVGLSFHFYIKHNNKLIRYYVDYDDDGNAFTNQSEFEGYFLSDFNIVKKFWDKRIQLNLGVKNIFDVKNVNYVNLSSGTHGGGVTEGQFPVGKGRKWHLGLIFHLQEK